MIFRHQCCLYIHIYIMYNTCMNLTWMVISFHIPFKCIQPNLNAQQMGNMPPSSNASVLYSSSNLPAMPSFAQQQQLRPTSSAMTSYSDQQFASSDSEGPAYHVCVEYSCFVFVVSYIELILIYFVYGTYEPWNMCGCLYLLLIGMYMYCADYS